MKKLYLKATKDTPEVILSPNDDLFSIKGICHPENIILFFKPVMKWLEEYKSLLVSTNSTKEIVVKFFFRYFNSATYKYLITLLRKFKEFTEIGSSLSIEWYYELEDEEMRESGEELFEYCGFDIPRKFIESKFK